MNHHHYSQLPLPTHQQQQQLKSSQTLTVHPKQSASDLVELSSSNKKLKNDNDESKPENAKLLPIEPSSKNKKIIFAENKPVSETTSVKSAFVTKKKFTIWNYSYVVLAASFISYMLASLLSSCFGVFFESMESDLGWSKSKVAFIGAVISALQDLTGPISSALTNQYGCRKTALVGGLIAAFGIIGSAYVNTFWLFGFLMGGVSGFGSSMVLVSSVVVVTYYFEEKPSFAAGLTISGGSLGQSIFSMIIIQLNETYGRSGCFLILGGILLNIVVCAALFRPLQWELENSDDDYDDEEEEDDEDEEEDDEEDEDEEEEDHTVVEATPSKSKISVANGEKSGDKVDFLTVNETNKSGLVNKSPPPVASQELTEIGNSRIFFDQIQLNNEELINLNESNSFLQMPTNKIFSSDSCLPTRVSNYDMPKLERSISRISLCSKTGLVSEDKVNLGYVKKLSLSCSLNRCGSIKEASKTRNAFFSDPSTLNYSKYVHSIHHSPHNELDDAKADIKDEDEYIFVENPYEIDFNNPDAIINCDNEFYFPAITVNRPTSTQSLIEDNTNNKAISHQNIDFGELFMHQESSVFDKNDEIKSEQDKKDPVEAGDSVINMNPGVIKLAQEQPVSSEGSKPAQAKQQSRFMRLFKSFFNKEPTNGNKPEEMTPSSARTQPVKGKNQPAGGKVLKMSNQNGVVKQNSVGSGSQKPVLTNTTNRLGLTSNAQKITQPKLFITKCNCKQRHIQNLRRIYNRRMLESLKEQATAASNGTKADMNLIKFNKNLISKHLHSSLESPPFGAAQTTNDVLFNNFLQNNKNLSKLFRTKGLRHFSNCPFFYLNNENWMKINHPSHPNHQHQNHHHHHHHHKQGQKQANYFYVPNLFQNQYRFPMHFKNVYYYKSLVNLNMRLMALKKNRRKLTLRDLGTNQDLNNLSISCPDLQMKQVLVMKPNRPKKSFDLDLKQFKPKQPKLVSDSSAKDPPLSSRYSSKVLNAGNILLKPQAANAASEEKKAKLISEKKESLEKTSSLDKSLNSLDNDYTDRIAEPDDKTGKQKLLVKAKKANGDECSSEDFSEDYDEEEEDEVEPNCFTKTKVGAFLYKYAYRLMLKPLRFISYSIVENLKLFRLFRFSVFALCNFILSFFYESPFIFINAYMIQNDLSQNQAGTVTVAVGLVSVVSSILYGYIGDSKKIDSIILYSISLILCGICCCAIPFFISNYLVTMLLMNLVGALISVSDVLVPTICVNIVGYDDFVNAYGLMFFCQGLASLTGPPLLGMIVDHFGSYDLSYYIIGVGIATSGFILTSILCYNKCEEPNSKVESVEEGINNEDAASNANKKSKSLNFI